MLVSCSKVKLRPIRCLICKVAGVCFWSRLRIYEGQIIGIHSRNNDLAVNPVKGKQLTNVRASGTDEALTLSPPIRHSLEQAIEFIEDDELVEVTPRHIRLRKNTSPKTNASE